MDIRAALTAPPKSTRALPKNSCSSFASTAMPVPLTFNDPMYWRSQTNQFSPRWRQMKRQKETVKTNLGPLDRLDEHGPEEAHLPY